MPQRCPLARENDYFDDTLRQLLVKSHRIIFRIEEPAKIVRVLYVRSREATRYGRAWRRVRKTIEQPRQPSPLEVARAFSAKTEYLRPGPERRHWLSFDMPRYDRLSSQSPRAPMPHTEVFGSTGSHSVLRATSQKSLNTLD